MAGDLAPDPLRERILDAATELFQRGGYQGATADEISESAGITKRTLYRRMHDKETILFEIHEQFLRRLSRSLSEIDPTDANRLKAAAVVHMSTIAGDTSAIRVFYEETKHLSPERRAAIVSQRDDYWQIVQQIIRSERDAGTFRKIDVLTAAHGLLGALNESYRWYRPDGGKSPVEIAGAASSLFLNGLRINQSPPPDLRGWKPPVVVDEADRWVSSPTLASILDAATKLFGESGYQGTPTADIADAVGLTKANLYYHIGSKNELLFQIINQMNRNGLLSIEATVKESGDDDPTVLLTKMFILHAHLIIQRRAAFAVFNEDYKHVDEKRRDALRIDRERYTKIWEETVARGQRAKQFRKVDVRLTVLFIMGSLNTLYRWYRADGRLTPAGIGEELADVILQGMRNRAS
jgi:AcrR family transcriptional regulator